MDILLQPLDYFHPVWLPEQPQKQAQHLYFPYFFSLEKNDIGSLEDILLRPHALFVEIGDRSHISNTLDTLIQAHPDFAVSLTSASAWHRDLAHTTARCLNDRFGLQNAKAMQITTCLQEAITNAIVHGNLRLKSDFASMEDMDRHYALITSRLARPYYGAQRVNLLAWERANALELAVSDSGDGFSLASSNPNDRMPHGRGLMLMQSLASRIWVGSDRKTLHLTFTYQE